MIKNILAVALLTAATISTSAFAVDRPYYFALDIGRADMKDGCDDPLGGTCKKTDIAYRIAGGYQFTPMWGTELSYGTYGKTIITGFTQIADYKARGFQVDGTGTLPLGNNFSVTGKLGLARIKVQSSSSFGTENGSRTTPVYGIGVQYELTKNVAARAQYENLGRVGEEATTGRLKLTLLSAGVMFKF